MEGKIFNKAKGDRLTREEDEEKYRRPKPKVKLQKPDNEQNSRVLPAESCNSVVKKLMIL